MNYKRIYNKLIQKRINAPIKEGYKEKHHIIPKSLGGSDEKYNIVHLTAREHFIAHYLLAKVYKKESNEWYKMNHAFMMMKMTSSNQCRYFNSRLYESLRSNFSKVMSNLQSGKGNSQFGTIWIYNLELKESKKIPKGDIPDGWLRGRKIKFDDLLLQEVKTKELLKRKEEMKIDTIKHFENYINSDYTSLNQFSKTLDFSLVTLTKRFIKYIDGYSSISSQGASNLKGELTKLLSYN